MCNMFVSPNELLIVFQGALCSLMNDSLLFDLSSLLPTSVTGRTVAAKSLCQVELLKVSRKLSLLFLCSSCCT